MLTIVMPLGGEGRAFAERGSPFPKPLVEVDGRPMIELVVRSLTPAEPHRFVFVCRDEHLRKFALGDVLRLVAPGCEIVRMHGPTAGALTTVLLAMDHLPSDGELLVANGDQVLDRPLDDLLFVARAPGVDGCIATFPATHPKWSYARVEQGEVVAVAEKRPISRSATCGLYYFRTARGFVEAAEATITKNAALGGEFYVCPAYNELILRGRRVIAFPVSAAEFHPLAGPDDVDRYRDHLRRAAA